MVPFTWQCFLWAAATVIFGQFWSIFFAKSACHIHCRGGGKNGVQMSFHPPQKGRFSWAVTIFQNWGPLSKIGGYRLWGSHWLGQHVAEAFLELRAGPQFRRTSWYPHPAMIKQSRNRQENNKYLMSSWQPDLDGPWLRQQAQHSCAELSLQFTSDAVLALEKVYHQYNWLTVIEDHI